MPRPPTPSLTPLPTPPIHPALDTPSLGFAILEKEEELCRRGRHLWRVAIFIQARVRTRQRHSGDGESQTPEDAGGQHRGGGEGRAPRRWALNSVASARSPASVCAACFT